MANAKKKRLSALERLVRFLEAEESPVAVGKPLALDDERLAPLLEIAKSKDPRVHAFLETLVRREQSFCLADFEAYPDQLLRGKRGEPWNADAKIVGPRDICLARNGAGDIYVWNGDTGAVRFLIHDEGWKKRAQHANVDDFLEEALGGCVESLDVDQLDESDEAYLARLRVALEIGGEDGLDEDARERLVELRLLKA